RSASPAQQVELLSLAGRQGLLYAHQLPALPNGSRHPPPADTPPAVAVLSPFLAGQTAALAPVRVPAVAVADTDLDDRQRDAVARALGTPDLCLIQGFPVTGKSRVVTEVVTQAAARGERVLLLAPTAAAIDRVLESVGGHDAVCA